MAGFPPAIAAVPEAGSADVSRRQSWCTSLPPASISRGMRQSGRSAREDVRPSKAASQSASDPAKPSLMFAFRKSINIRPAMHPRRAIPSTSLGASSNLREDTGDRTLRAETDSIPTVASRCWSSPLSKSPCSRTAPSVLMAAGSGSVAAAACAASRRPRSEPPGSVSTLAAQAAAASKEPSSM